eukprot:scaffold25308_cov124-Isochrysis_galbana.AAC.3
MSRRIANKSPTRALSSATAPETYQWRTQARLGLPRSHPPSGEQDSPGGSAGTGGRGQWVPFASWAGQGT